MLTPEQLTEAARITGRRGGLKGGPARAAKLTAKQLSRIGRKGAVERWRQWRAKQAEAS